MIQHRIKQQPYNDGRVRFARVRPDEGQVCDRCKSAEYPVCEIYYIPSITYHLCVYCMGDAIEAVTGWRIVPLLARWHRISPLYRDMPNTLIAAAGIRPSNRKTKRKE